MTKLNGTIILMDIGEYDKLLQKWSDENISVAYESGQHFHVFSEEVTDDDLFKIVGKNLNTNVLYIFIDSVAMTVVVISKSK